MVKKNTTGPGEPCVNAVFNSHHQESFIQILMEVGDMESEWTMSSTSIVKAAARSCGRTASGAWWHHLAVRDSASGLAVGGGASSFQEVRLASALEKFRVASTFGLTRSIYSRVQKRRIWPTAQFGIHEEQSGFPQSRGSVDQLHGLHQVFEGSWELGQPVHMDLWIFVSLD